jgi:hypothetical protein
MSASSGAGDIPAQPDAVAPDPAARRRRWWSRAVLYPFLFATFPIVFLVAANDSDRIPTVEVLAPLAIALAATGVVFAICWAVFRDPHTAGFLTSALVLLFFTFGHVWMAADPYGAHGAADGLFWSYVLLAVVFVLVTIRFRTRFARLTPGLNLIAGVLVLINLAPIVTSGAANAQGSGGAVGEDVALRAPAHERDVYYIIFDRYADEVTLQDDYAFDNTPFLGQLGDRGFDVVTDAVGNYPRTSHSLASSLNMSFLDDLVAEEGPDSDDWPRLQSNLQDFRVSRALQAIGYRYEHIGSWWGPTREDPTADDNFVYGGREFPTVLLNTTIWGELSAHLGLSHPLTMGEEQYRRITYQYDSLLQIAEQPGPTFTFAHFTLPHPPYVIDANGDFLPPEKAVADPNAAYVGQVEYANHLMLELSDRLLAGPDETDPIIVFQSDEGPHPIRLEQNEQDFDWTKATDTELGMKMRILDAVYLPGEGSDAQLGSFTPVNTFRIIFDRYFGADLPLLPDRTWVFQDGSHPYRLTEITDHLAQLQT